MENNNQGISKNSTAIKVAELATIFYAILVFMSLLIDSAYYSQFNIRIVSYMSISEILLSCIENLHQYAIPLLASIAALIAYHFLFIDPFSKMMLDPRKWLKKISDQDRVLSHRFYFYFGQRTSTHAKYSIVAHYNFIAFLLPLCVGLSTLGPLSDIISKYSSSQNIIFCVLLAYAVILYFFLGNYNHFREQDYDWSKHPLFEKMYAGARFRKDVAPHHFTRTEKKMIELNYKYRHVLVCLSFFISLFVSLCLGMYFTAKDVKENGNNTCVVMQRNGEIIDTRTQNIDYIGESAGFIFIYDRATQGTMVYERQSLDSYLFIEKSACHLDEISNECAPITQNYTSLVKQSVIDSLTKRNEMIPCDFEFEHPHMNYLLAAQDINHTLWVDTTNNTYLEQITLPKDMYSAQPSCEDLFCLDQYYKDGDRQVKHGARITQNTYHGKDGENILTLVCTGKNHNAWLYFDPTGRNIQYGDEIFKSLSMKYPAKEQINILLSNMNQEETMILILFFALSSCVFLIFPFIITRKSRLKNKKGEKQSAIERIRNRDIALIGFLMFLLYIICHYICSQMNPYGNTNNIIELSYLTINGLLAILGTIGGLIIYKKHTSNV